MRRRSAGFAAVVTAVLLLVAGPAAASPASGGGVRATPPLPDTGANGEWWFTSWQIPKVWAAGARGQGVTVALIDSGVQASFPELRGVVLPGTDFAGGDGRTDQSRRIEGNANGHGTHMALAIAGQGGPLGLVGVAPAVRILPVVRTVGEGDLIRWAVDHGAKVINMSFIAPSMSCPDDVRLGVRYALDHGAVVVAATGNSGSRDDGGFPANCPGVLAVGAVDAQLQLWNRSNQGPYVGAVAPGVRIPMPDLKREMGKANGTSISAALASGAVALVWSKFPRLTNRQVVARLLATARDGGPAGFDEGFGYGLVRPYRAITSDVPPDAPNPIFDRAEVASPSPSPSDSAGGPVTVGDAGSAPAGEGRLPAVVLVSGGLILAVVVLVVLLAVLVSRRRRGAPPVGLPGAPGPYPGPPPGPYPAAPYPYPYPGVQPPSAPPPGPAPPSA